MKELDIDGYHRSVLATGRRRRAVSRLRAGVAGMLGLVAVAIVWSSQSPSSESVATGGAASGVTDESSPTTGAAGTSQPEGAGPVQTTAPSKIHSDRRIYSMNLPRGWHVAVGQYPAAEAVRPDSFDSLSIATFDSSPTATLECDLPLGSLEQLGPTDAFISVRDANPVAASATRR